jgi:4-carboxymuconolactone decarboxylase
VRLHVRGAINNGLSRETIQEIILQVAIYCGVPAALDSMKVCAEVFKEMDAEAATAAE